MFTIIFDVSQIYPVDGSMTEMPMVAILGRHH